MERAKFNTATKFELTEEEIKHFYILMALMQYPDNCTPDYREERLIRRLRNNFYHLNQEIAKRCEADTNNLSLNRMSKFIQQHYGNLKRIAKDLPQEEVLG